MPIEYFFRLRITSLLHMIQGRSRLKYHSTIANLYIQHKEHLLPAEFRRSIPYSTISTWRNLNTTSFAGHEFCSIQNQGLEWVELFQNHQRLKRTITILCKVWISLHDIFIPAINKNKAYHERLINEIQRLLVHLPKKTAFRLVGISSGTFHYRLHKLKSVCVESPLALCFKRHPLQLTYREVKTMKDLFFDERFLYWPVSSIAYYARRMSLLNVSISTWYKYLLLLGLNKKRFKPLQKTIGIRSAYPNQFLHVDTTFFTYSNGIMRAIVFVSDNFSKTILGHSFCEFKSANNVKQALLHTFQTIRQYYPDHVCANLVADGGSENHAVTIDQLLLTTQHPEITKIIALKDIAFSNSPIEAVHKIMKGYLRIQNPQNDEQLELCLSKNVYDYNCIRPYGGLKGMTPMEVYSKHIPVLDFAQQTALAKMKRIQQNRIYSCQQC
jgi:transposase InsO family protein